PTTPGNGMSVVTDTNGNVQTVNFFEVSPTFDSLPATTLIVNATNASNAINYTTGKNSFANFFANPPVLDPTWGEVTVDNQEPIEFTSKLFLVINGLAGSDTINLNNPFNPGGTDFLGNPRSLTQIGVDGGDPTGLPTSTGDTVIVNGQAGFNGIHVFYEAINLIPFSGFGPTAPNFDEAHVTGAQLVPVDIDHAELLVIDGQGDNSGTGGDDLFV